MSVSLYDNHISIMILTLALLLLHKVSMYKKAPHLFNSYTFIPSFSIKLDFTNYFYHYFWNIFSLWSSINPFIGEPEIECGPTSITINFNTRNAFEGHVYVKGLYDQEGCRNDEGGRQVAGISLPFDSCNVARTRSLNPRGIAI